MIWSMVRVLIALAIVVVIARFALSSMRSYVQGAWRQAEERETPPVTVEVGAEDVRFGCPTCGLEVLLTKVAEDADELKAPRHCREEMVVVSNLST